MIFCTKERKNKNELVAGPGRGRVNEYSVMIVIDCSLLMSDVGIIKSDLDFFLSNGAITARGRFKIMKALDKQHTKTVSGDHKV